MEVGIDLQAQQAELFVFFAKRRHNGVKLLKGALTWLFLVADVDVPELAEGDGARAEVDLGAGGHGERGTSD